ncbi:MAG: ComF family protein [Oscillospiraceae bacterium]|nr:ComF family protein [Oscillospiraceae bacterium]
MGLQDSLNAIEQDVTDFFFPRRCPFCGKLTGKALLCPACEKTLPFTGEQAVHHTTFARCAAPLYYEDRVRRAVLRFKFHRKLGGLNCFGEMMARCAAEWYAGAFDAVTWVPVSAKRRRKRGYDQSQLLAASLCVDWHVTPVETLRKTADNPPQSATGESAARRANVAGVYEADPSVVAGRRWLLVDDIFTTGATMAECVHTLRLAGAADVVCLTLAVVRNRENRFPGE